METGKSKNGACDSWGQKKQNRFGKIDWLSITPMTSPVEFCITWWIHLSVHFFFSQIPVFVSISQEMRLAKSLQCIIGSIMDARITTLATQTVPAESFLFFAVCLLVIWDDAPTSKALNWYKKRPPLSVVMCREYYSMNAKPTQDITASVRPSAPCTLSQ